MIDAVLERRPEANENGLRLRLAKGHPDSLDELAAKWQLSKSAVSRLISKRRKQQREEQNAGV
jgi:hypothetical protein